ncbi:death domain-associated protein 6 [Pleurodeles waltl]|uniref:death domain-associated protein 6 n=1 Tax=Pleurodeles waltl TaxID=8319 RepID=UPI003709580C
MAKQDGGIIVLDDDDDDDELKIGSSWVARPWKLPSPLNVQRRTFTTGSLTQTQSPSSASNLPLKTHPSTSKANLRSVPCTQSQTPPSTSKSHPTTHLSSSESLPAPQTNGSDVMSVSDKESAQILLKATNEKLFKEFMDLCGNETVEHPEVMSFLLGRYQKASPAFLASTEFRNVIGRCLTRVQNKKSKVYVYINELCTVLKSNSEKKKVVLSSAPAPASKQKQSQQLQSHPPADNSAIKTTDDFEQDEKQEDNEDTGAETKEDVEHRKASKRQIRYLENLLSVYTTEIRRLQEKELDLTQLDDEDSIYIQENRLKRKMIRIFEKLCELKSCCSLTGRVIEQRIPYRGTRYPEVNRHIQKFINKPDNFPDYGDILKVIEKANIRHSLDLTKRQMQSMAADAFREVGNRLQERRHLDMVYNFGSHLTDQYKAGTDPALMDPTLARRLRENRSVALTHLDEVVRKYAVMQDEGEEEMDRRRRRGSMQLRRGVKGSPASSSIDQESEEDEKENEEQEEEDDYEDEDDVSSDTDIEEELQKCEDLSEPEEEAAEEEPVLDITEIDQRMDNRSEPSQFSSAGEEVEDEDDEDDEDEDEEEEDDDTNVKNDKDFREPQGGLTTKPDYPKWMENHSKSTELNSKEKKCLKIDALGSYGSENMEPMELEVITEEVPKQDINEGGVLVKQHRQIFLDPESNADPVAEESDEHQEVLQQEDFVLNIEPLYVSDTDSPQMLALVPSSTPSSVPVKAQSDFHTSAKSPNASSSEPETLQVSSTEPDCASLEPSVDTETMSQRAVLLNSLQTHGSTASSPGSESTASEIMLQQPALPQASCELQSILIPESAKAETSLPLMSSEMPSLSPHMSGGCSSNSPDSQNASCRTLSPIHLTALEPSVPSTPSQSHSLPKSSKCQDSSIRTSESQGGSSQLESEPLKLSGSHVPSPEPSASSSPSSSPSSQMALSPCPDGSISHTQSPRSTVSLSSSSQPSSLSATPKLPGSPSTSPRPPDSTSVCQGLPESSTSWTTSPQAVCTGPTGASSPCSSASRTTSPESSQLCLSQGAPPKPARSLRSGASKLQSVSSGLSKTKLCSRTKSSDASNSSADCGKRTDSLGFHNSDDVSLKVPRDLQLNKDIQLSSGACKDTSAVHKGSMKRSKDKLVLAEKTDTPHTEPLLLKDLSRESRCLNATMPLVPKSPVATCVTKLNLKSETSSNTPVKRKRTLADTVKTLQSKFDSSSQENGRKLSVATINGNPGVSFLQSHHQPKRARRDDSYHNSNVGEVHSINSDSDNEEGNISLDLHVTCVTPDSPGPLVDSTQDSAFLNLVNSSPFSSRPQHKSTKINAATQCDPEEVIVLSDSD